MDTAQIEAVIPLVPVTVEKDLPEYMDGWLLYRSKQVPIIDITKMILGRASKKVMSTRIALIRCFSEQWKDYVGIKAERMIDYYEIEDHLFESSQCGKPHGFFKECPVILGNRKYIYIDIMLLLKRLDMERFLRITADC